MPREDLERLHAQAAASSPEIRAAALLRIARVESAFDREASLRTFDAAIVTDHPLAGEAAQWFPAQARMVAAAIAPERVGEFRVEGRAAFHLRPDSLANIMVQHGRLAEAVAYVLQLPPGGEFPFGFVTFLIHRVPDVDAGRRLLRHTVERWRATRSELPLHETSMFYGAFDSHWKLLPDDEALAVVHEVVEEAHRHSSTPATCGFGPEESVTFTSWNRYILFQTLHVLRRLDPILADSVTAEHPELVAAAHRFPEGMETLRQEVKARSEATRAQQGQQCGGGFIMAGAERDFPYLNSLMDARNTGEFDAPLEHGLELYRRDANPVRPNLAPKDYWPSTGAFRQTIYSAAKRLGARARTYLDRIPSADLRLFAEIELEAALAGLPELPGSRMERFNRY